MKSRWIYTLFAAAPFVAVTLFLQSCAGEGGPIANGGGGISAGNAFNLLLSTEQQNAKYIGSEACADCHGGRAGDPIYTHWKETQHAKVNVGCEQCHGPGGAHKANPTKANILTFPKLTSVAVCGQCHGPIVEQWQFSQHSKLIASPVDSTQTSPSQTRSSRCVACHSGLFRTQILEQGLDMGAMTDAQIIELGKNTTDIVPHVATCATCHNPHSQTGNLNADGEERQLRHKTFNVDTAPVGPSTAASSFTQYDHICAECHNGRGTDPSDAKLATGTSRPSMHDSNQFNMLLGFGGVEGNGPVVRNTAHAQAPGQCSKCHMPDARHTFTTSYDKSCAPCHTAADAASRVTSVKDEVLSGLLSLRTAMENWAQAKFGDSLFWEYTSNIQAEGKTPPNQSLVPPEIKRARHNYYFIVRDRAFGPHNAPYAKHLLTIAGQNMTALGWPPPGKPDGNLANLTIEQKTSAVMIDLERTRRAERLYPND